MKHFDRPNPPMGLHAIVQSLVNELHEDGRKMWKALGVIALDPKIRAWLQKNDPKALEQVDAARDTSFEVIDNDDGSVVITPFKYEGDARAYIANELGSVPGTPESRGTRYIVRPK